MNKFFTTKPLSELTVEELQKKKELFNSLKYGMIVVMVVLTLTTVIRICLDVHSSGSAVPLFMCIFLSARVDSTLKKIAAEIDARAKLNSSNTSNTSLSHS